MAEKPLTVIIVEDDPSDCNALLEAFASAENAFEVVGTTGDSSDAVKMVESEQPDVVILDLELHKGGGDGLEFLRSLASLQMNRPPFVVVTTNNLSTVVYRTARELGAEYIFTKTQKGYCGKTVVDFLTTVKGNLQRTAVAPENNGQVSPAARENNLNRIIRNELDKVGISVKMKGYTYLQCGILLAVNGHTGRFTEEVAKQFNETKANVERAMQNAINKAWATESAEQLYANYTAKIQSDKGVPTLTEFIFHYARKIQNKPIAI